MWHYHLNGGQPRLKVQSCKLCNDKYMIASTRLKDTDISAFIVLLVFKLSSCKILFINRIETVKT